MEFVYKTLCLFIYTMFVTIQSQSFECSYSDGCLCYQPTPSTYEFHCPPESPNVLTRTNLHEIEVECMVDIDWEVQNLPKLNMDHVSFLHITMCPLPKQGLDGIMMKLNINRTETLKYSYTTTFFNGSLWNNIFNRSNDIKVLDASDNNLQYVPENEFVSFTKLSQLDLSKNLIKALPTKILAPLLYLQVLNLSNNNIKTLPDAIFDKNTALEVLDLSANPIQWSTLTFHPRSSVKWLSLANTEADHVPNLFFKNLSSLEHLDLSNNHIAILHDHLFQSLPKLIFLNLEKNYLTAISKKLLQNNRALKHANFGNNNISVVNIHAFQRNVDLQEISLANNRFKLSGTEVSLGVSPFQANVNLERLYLSKNLITDISDDWVLSKTRLKLLDLSHNQIKKLMLTDLMGVSPNLTIDLSYNKISSIDFRMANYIGSTVNHLQQRVVVLDENPLECDCFLYDFARYLDGSINPQIPLTIKVIANHLKCAGPERLRGKPVTQINYKMLTCDVEKCPEKCNCGFRVWNRALTIDCSNRNLTNAPVLTMDKKFQYNHTEVDLRGNSLSTGPSQDMGYDNIQILKLAFNNISVFSWIPNGLQVLDLSNNNIRQLEESTLYMFNAAPTLLNIMLGNNPWACGCPVLTLRSFLITHLISKRIIDADNIKCKHSAHLVIHLNANDVCVSSSSLIVICSLVLALTASGISMLTCACAFTRKKRVYTPF